MSAARDDSLTASPRPGSLSFQSGAAYLLGKAGSVARQRWAAALAATGLSPNQFLVLMALAETGSVCQQFLAGSIGVDPRNVVPILDSLEGRGLVSRATDPADRRRRLIDLTSAGRRIAARLCALGEETERDLLAPLSPAEQQNLRRLLGAILGGLAARGAGSPQPVNTLAKR